jgi:hypothetical protein
MRSAAADLGMQVERSSSPDRLELEHPQFFWRGAQTDRQQLDAHGAA